MKCNEIKDLLSLYIDQMIEEDQAKEVEKHLSACDSCRNEYLEMKEIAELLGQTVMLPVPEAFSFRLKKALKEEKENMIQAGEIKKTTVKKRQWRMITSVAAVFAVGVISLSLYHDILGVLPDKIDGGSQMETAQPEENYDALKAESDMSGNLDGNTDTSLSSDGSVMMKDGVDELQAMTAMEPPVSDSALRDAGSEELRENTYNIAADTVPNTGEGAAGAPSFGESAAGDGAAGFDEDSIQYKSMSPADCSRSLTSSGVERNAAAVQYYDNLIEEKLSGFDYQVLESAYSNTGEWLFRIFIFRGKDGNTYNEEIMICGKDGEIKVICSNEFMGL